MQRLSEEALAFITGGFSLSSVQAHLDAPHQAAAIHGVNTYSHAGIAAHAPVIDPAFFQQVVYAPAAQLAAPPQYRPVAATPAPLLATAASNPMAQLSQVAQMLGGLFGSMGRGGGGGGASGGGGGGDGSGGGGGSRGGDRGSRGRSGGRDRGRGRDRSRGRNDAQETVLEAQGDTSRGDTALGMPQSGGGGDSGGGDYGGE